MLSIVLVAWNEGSSYVERTVKSIPPQYDIVVVDDCSTDGCCNNLDKMYPNVTLIRNQQRKGAIYSRNLGADKAKGCHNSMLLFLDAHMEAQGDAIQKLEQSIASHPDSLVTGAIFPMDDPTNTARGYGARTDKTLSIKWESKATVGTGEFEVAICPGGITGCTKDLFNKIGGFDDGLHMWSFEDVEMSLRCWGLGGTIVCNPAAEISHRFKSGTSPNVDGDGWVYNKFRTALMHFDGEDFDSILAGHAGGGGDRMVKRLESEPEFKKRLERYRSMRVHNGNWLMDKFGIQL